MSDGGQLEAANVVRRELRLFLNMADLIGIDGDRQRRFLRLSQDGFRRTAGSNCSTFCATSRCRRIRRFRCCCGISAI
jgi:hypothetical protein